jgi:hypothetical protein
VQPVVPKVALDAAAAAVAAATAQVGQARLPSTNSKEGMAEVMGVPLDLVCRSANGTGAGADSSQEPADLLAVAATALGAHPIQPAAAASSNGSSAAADGL